MRRIAGAQSAEQVSSRTGEQEKEKTRCSPAGYCSTVLIAALVLSFAFQAFAGTREDLEFAKGLFARKWFDWAEEVVVEIIESGHTSYDTRGWAAELHLAILNAWSKDSGDDRYREKAEALAESYPKKFPDHDAWGTAASFAKLQRRGEAAQDKAKKAEIETNKEKKEQLSKEALALFKEIDSAWERLVKYFRDEVAKYPPKFKWGQWAQNAPKAQQDRLLQTIWFRNLAEYLYATSFIYYAKVVPEEKRQGIITRGLKKYMRFIDGEPENDKDGDPPAVGQQGLQDPDPRDTYRMLLYLAEIGIGQCCLELGKYEEAISHFDYMVQAELPQGSETSEPDLRRIVDIRLQAYYLEGYAFNLLKKHSEAEKILEEMLDQSGREIQPERPEIAKYWAKQGRPEVALFPDVRENVFGKFAAFQRAKALTALGRYAEGIAEAYKIFAIEQASRKGGEVSPFEVEAAKTMADLSKQLGSARFPIGPAFAVARGFHYQEMWEDAIFYYKKAYSATGSPEAIREYGPKALFELGKLLYTTERYLEAGIAMAEVCQRFKEFPQIGQASGLLKKCFKKVRDLAKKSGKLSKFEQEKYDWAIEVAERTVPESIGPITRIFERAAEYAREGNYELAAETYASIPKTYNEPGPDGEPVKKAVHFYAYARAQVGYCRYMLYLKGKKKKDSKDAIEQLQKAIELLENALNEAAETENSKANITARYYLAKCLVEDAWKGKDAKDKAKKALSYLTPLQEKFKEHKKTQGYMPDIWATTALAHFKLGDYDSMHEAFLALERDYGQSTEIKVTGFKFFELLKAKGDTMAKADLEHPELALPHYKKAGHYLMAWYHAAKRKLKPNTLLWAGNEMVHVKSFKAAAELFEAFIKTLPPPERRTKKQKDRATAAKVYLAEARYGMGDYEAAAGLFDLLRRVIVCPNPKCGHEDVLAPKNFDKLPMCPKCKPKEVRMERVNDNNLQIQEGAAKSYLAMYEKAKAGKKNMVALNKAQDIYQRILKKITPYAHKPEYRNKYWEVIYTIVKIWYYKRDFGRIVGEIRNMILGVEGDQDNPTEDDWKNALPDQPWRGMIRKLYEKALKATKGKKK